jgi:dCTP deaminase
MLTGDQILVEVAAGRIKITPFSEDQINPNSYNLRLGNTLKVYTTFPLDPRQDNPTKSLIIPEEGRVLKPNKLYLGATIEVTDSRDFIPELDGRSSTARLGLSVHQTGGFGDLGFRGRWTLEIVTVHPLIIYPGLEICQVRFVRPDGPIGRFYDETGRYYDQMEPVSSRMHLAKRIPRTLGGRCPHCGYDMSTCAPGAPCPRCT